MANDTKKWRVAIFASGNGSNAVNIIQYLRSQPLHVEFIIYVNQWRSSKTPPGILEKAKALDVPTVVFSKEELHQKDGILHQLTHSGTDLIVLAGFLWLMPKHIVDAYIYRIVNIHPSLLPKYGGKGMFGSRVHQAVKEHGDARTGISIHYVNEKYDDGDIILQAATNIAPHDSLEQIAQKVQKLEHTHFPYVVEELLLEYNKNTPSIIDGF